MISCILLSAGYSSRFGSPKALAQIGDEHAIVKLQNMLIASEVSEVIIVLGAHKSQIKPHLLKHKKVRAVYNKNYNFGQTSSFQCGLDDGDQDSTGYMLLPVDYPFVTRETVDTLISAFLMDQDNKILIPVFDRKKGHPPLFSADLKEEFLNLSQDCGINTVAHRHKDQTRFLDLDDSGIVQTFNTQEELKRLGDFPKEVIDKQ